MKKTIAVFAKRVGRDLELEQLGNDLPSLQAFVGGHIEAIYPADGLTMICNEEGKLLGLPVNFYAPSRGEYIVGDVFFARMRDEEFDSVKRSDRAAIEEFMRVPGSLMEGARAHIKKIQADAERSPGDGDA